MGVEISVSASGGVPGAAEIESSFSATFGMEWDWSASRSKTVTSIVAPGDWVQLTVSPAMQKIQGSYDLTSTSDYYGYKDWSIQNVTATRPDPGEVVDYRVLGNTLTSDELSKICSTAAAAARRNGTAPATPGLRVID